MQYRILHQQHYYQRELFALEIDGKYALVYRGSGLNGGKIGKVLPFSYIKTEMARGFSEAITGVGIGWIAKEVFFGERYVDHRKNIKNFGREIEDFVTMLENTLPGITKGETFEDEYIDTDFVKKVSSEINSTIEGMKPFDWKTLTKTPNTNQVTNQFT